jgi:hypothetical protein
MSGIRSSGLSRAVVQAMIDAIPAGGGVITPGVVPDLLTVGHPLVGSWWANTPMMGSLYMVQSTSNGYGFTAFGGGTGGAAAGPIGLAFTSVAAVNQGCGWYNFSVETTLSRRPWLRGRIKVSATDTDQAVYIGFSGFGGPFGAGGVLADNSVMLTVDRTTGAVYGPDATWQIRSRAAGSVTTIDTAVPYTASHDYDVYLSADATTVTWAVYDRTAGIAYGAAGVANANPPGASTNLGVVYYGMSGAAGAALVLTWGPCTRGHFGPA